ncbi:acyl-CoA dehydrogenase family protein [Thermodesulfobacteriota bacterium]
MIKGGSFLTSAIQPEDIFIPEDMNEDQKLIAAATEEFVRGEVEPRIDELETKTEGMMEELIKKSADIGLLGVDIPEKYEGTQLDYISSLIITEKTARYVPFAITCLTHNTFCGWPVLYFGNDDQKQQYLPELAIGKKIGAYALTEPDAGSDVLNIKTIARLSKDGEFYILNGEKQFTSNAGFADVIILYAKVDGEYFAAFILDSDSEGLSLGEEEKKMGIHGSFTCGFVLSDLKVPKKNLLFQVGKGHMVAFNILNIGRHKLSGACIGAAKVAFDESLRYAKNRVQFGRSLSSFGLIKEKIGEMAIRVFVGESVIYRTSKLIEQGLRDKNETPGSVEAGFDLARRIEEYAAECSISKIYASELLDYVVDETVQIHGGYGYIKELPAERYYRDSRIFRIFGGTNEINRLLIVKMILKGLAESRQHNLEDNENTTSGLSVASNTCFQMRTLEELDNLIQNAKKITLISLRALGHAYPDNLDDHQELMGLVSNIIIEAYAMESCLLRALKIKQRKGEEIGEIPTAISKVYILDAFMRVEHWAKLIVSSINEGETLRQKLSNLETLTRYIPVNTVALRRKIADFLFKAGRYFIC